MALGLRARIFSSFIPRNRLPFLAYQHFHTSARMPSNENLLSGVASPVKVLAVGGSYAGLGAALDILDLCSGKVARMGRGDAPNPAHKINLQVTVVDERDGYC